MANKSKNKNNYLMVAADVIIADFGITTLFPAATMTTAYAQKANNNNNNIPAVIRKVQLPSSMKCV